MSRPIRIAIAGVGNCASSLVQGIAHYRQNPDAVGLAFPNVGGYRVADLLPVAAFDVDVRKVGRPLHEAVLAAPNNTKVFCPPSRDDVMVHMGPVLDGIATHMGDWPAALRFEPAGLEPADVVGVLRKSGAQVLVNYMPVGAQRASEFYADAAIRAGVALVNCVPCFVASDSAWARRFVDAGLPCVGDDIKAQFGATITHRALAKLCADRGLTLRRTYQLNTGGNTDFLNMLDRSRLADKRRSKTEAVQSQLPVRLPDNDIHIGPADFVPWQKDNKVCFLRIEAEGFGGVPVELELRLSVEDSPNSAGVVVDAIRAAQTARDRGLAGPVAAACAWCMKRPPQQSPDADARAAFAAFAAG